jgi:hypothetical protein
MLNDPVADVEAGVDEALGALWRAGPAVSQYLMSSRPQGPATMWRLWFPSAASGSSTFSSWQPTRNSLG